MDKAGASVVIVGAGHAGGECAAALRANGHAGPITLVGDEAHPPYHRPPLSKGYLLGETDVGSLLLRPTGFYPKANINLRTGAAVVDVDRDGHLVRLADNTVVPYERLVFATGGRARLLPADGIAGAGNVFYLRTIADVDGMRPLLCPDARLVVVGGGYIGLEVAAAARRLGLSVSILEAAPKLLSRVPGKLVSDFFARVHSEEGVDVRVGVNIAGFSVVGGLVDRVLISEGQDVPADIVVIGVGMLPNTDLAESAGLVVDDGIVVDHFCVSSDPDIYAIGDCSRHPCGENGGLRRLESVPNAAEQARVAACAILDKPEAPVSAPWFWSDQYDVKFKMVGLPKESDDIVVRGERTEGRSFSMFYLRDGAVRAAISISDIKTFAAAKRLVAARARVDPQMLADQAVSLKDLVSAETIS